MTSNLHVKKCSLCPDYTEYYCHPCEKDLCQNCKAVHVIDLNTKHHEVTIYREKFKYLLKQETCLIHHSRIYQKYCESCDIPACVWCLEHRPFASFPFVFFCKRGHNLVDIRTTYQTKRQQYKTNIHVIRSEQLYSAGVLLKRLKSDIQSCQSQIIKRSERVKDLMDNFVLEKIIKYKYLLKKIRRKEYMNISRIQNFEHCYEKFAYRPVMFLRFIKTTSLPKVQDTPHFTPHSMLSMTQEIDVEDLIKLLCVIKFTNRGKLQINQLLLTLKSSAECQKSFEVKGVDSFNHISCMTPDRVWVSDFNKIILTDKATGNKIHVVKDPLHSFSGSHTVNSTQELIYINKKHKIIKLSKDRKTTNTFIKKPKSLWEPSCLYSSPSSGDLLVGMHRHDTNTGTGIVIRYDNTGNYIQTIPHINIPQKLYGLPMFITENNNGDVVVSDVCMHAVVVTSSEGNHRFSYTGTSTSRSDYCTSKIWWPKGSGLSPRGICTDALSHILVCDIYSDTVQMLSQDGQFLKYLAKDSHAFLPSSLSYDVQSHCLFVGHQPWQTKISLYRHINRVQLAPVSLMYHSLILTKRI